MGLFLVFLLLILLSLPIVFLIIFIIKNIDRQSSKSKEFKESIKKCMVPPSIQRTVKQKFAQYKPADFSINDVVNNLGLFKSASTYNYATLSSKVTFSLYPTLTFKNMFNLKNPLVRCYSISRYHGFMDLKNYTQYSAIPLREGLLECFFTDKVLNVSLEGNPIGTMDFNTHLIHRTNQGEVGRFTSPQDYQWESISIPGVGSYQFGYQYEVFMGDRKLASVIPQASTKEQWAQFAKAITSWSSVDLNFFRYPNLLDDWEAFMLLALGIVEYAKINYPVSGK